MSARVDEAKPMKEGDPLDVAALERVLRERMPTATGAFTLQRFPSGHSNLTYLARFGDAELVLRAPPPGASTLKSGAHDMEREHRILQRLHPHYPKAPQPVCFVEAAASPFGGAFYAMERKRGVVLRGTKSDLDAAQLRALSQNLVDGLVELHSIDVARAGLLELGKPDGYVQRQVTGWAERYEKAKTDDIAEMDSVAAWLRAHVPATKDTAFVHNDYKYDNVVLDPADPTKIIAVLDWELSTVGDPILDLGTTLAYWIDATDDDDAQQLPFGPTMLPGNLTRTELVARYALRSGRDVSNALFAYVCATFKVAVIAQQIYFRYAKGFTTDERFAPMIFGVKVLSARAARALDAGRIDAP